MSNFNQSIGTSQIQVEYNFARDAERDRFIEHPQEEDEEKVKMRFEWRGVVSNSSNVWNTFQNLEGIDQVKIPILGYLMFFAIGYCPWLLSNALFLQMPILIELPEQQSIASQMSLSIQSANLLILFYLLFQKIVKVDVKITVFSIMVLAILSSIAICIVWTASSLDTSLSILVLSFVVGTVGCLSNVSFWEFAAFYHPNLVSALAVGNAGSGLIPSIFAAIQRAGDNRIYDLSIFFVIMTVFLLISLTSFVVVVKTSVVRNCERSVWETDAPRKLIKAFGDRTGSVPKESERSSSIASDHSYQTFQTNTTNTTNRSLQSMNGSRRTSTSTTRSKVREINESIEYNLPEGPSRSVYSSWRELVVMCWISSLNYFIPGLIPFFVIDFADSDSILLWMTIFGMVGGTIGRLLSGIANNVYHFFFVLLQIILAVCFFLGPTFNWESWFGSILIFSNFLLNLEFGFHSTMIYKIASTHIDPLFARSLCRWLGVFEQIGALFGAAIGFILVSSGVFN